MLNKRPLVLIPSDDYEWVANFADGYRANGYDVIAGMVNFRLAGRTRQSCIYYGRRNITRGRIPTPKQIAEISTQLDWWAQRARLIFSVSNLYPHVNQGDASFHAFYTNFYKRAEVIHHFSQSAKDLVSQEYPSIAERNHIVFSGYNYERLLPATHDRSDCGTQLFWLREKLGDRLSFLGSIALLGRGAAPAGRLFARERSPHQVTGEFALSGNWRNPGH